MIGLFWQYIIIVIQSMALLFVAFVFVMELKTQFERTRYYPAIRMLFGLPFVVADCIVNYLLIPLFLDLPAHPLELVTGRMLRYKLAYAARPLGRVELWRYEFAVWLCRRLNRYDADHC